MSLPAFRDYCRAMAEDADDRRDRDLWRQLATEVDNYLDGKLDDPPPETHGIDPDELLFALEEQVSAKRREDSTE